MKRLAVFWTLAMAALTACRDTAPAWSQFQPGETGRVVRVMDGDSLVLDTGQSVRLVGIEAPAFGRDGRPDQPHAEPARRALEDMVLGRQVRLHYAGLTRDRYDRALAHVITDDRLGPTYWANLELAAAGHVRVRAYPDTAMGAGALFDAEAQARAGRAGLWRLGEYAPQDARDTPPDTRGFILVQGILGPRQPGSYDETACLRPLLGSQIRLDVDVPAMAVCDLSEGLRVEARGWLSRGTLTVNAAVNVRPQAAPALVQGPAISR